MPSERNTIFAKSSGAGRAGVSVFRVSGPRAGAVLDTFCGGRGMPREARLVSVRLPDGSLLDQGLALWFPAPRSFTGEDVAELHLHGSIAVERAFADAMIAFGLEPATAGAFTMRAFEAGKLDLTQTEGLGDLLRAETEGQRRQALGQLGGRLSEKAEEWRADILRSLAALEAAVDFPDEDDVPETVANEAILPIANLSRSMHEALSGAGGGRAIRNGVTVVITGPPNAGKSSLLNRLSGTDRAIVSDEPGTTRDLLEVRLEIADQLVILIDTAGLREAGSSVENEGIARARKAAATADLTIEVRDATDLLDAVQQNARTIYVANKTDLLRNRDDVPAGWVKASTLTVDGLDDLLAAIRKRLQVADTGVLTRDRHVALVRSALACLSQIDSRQAPEIVVENLRLALKALEELTGRIAPDDVLSEVFSAFCIGK